jgi:hypothetical protein
MGRTYLAVGSKLHALQRRDEVSGHHGGQPLPLDLQLGVTAQGERRRRKNRDTWKHFLDDLPPSPSLPPAL